MSAQPLRLGRRVETAGLALASIVASLGIGVAGAGAAVLFTFGVVLSPLWVGLPIMLAALAAFQRLAAAHRYQANRLLGAHIAPLDAPADGDGSIARRALDAIRDRRRARVVGVVVLTLPVAALLLAVALVPLLLMAKLLVLGVQGIGGLGREEYAGPLPLDLPAGVLLCVLAVACAILAIALLGALRVLMRYATRTLIAPPLPEEGPIREMLAQSLGDRTLSIAYWLPDREAFVDESGRPVKLPAPGSGRAWTAVERDGRRVAAIVHDAELDTGPELVNAVAAAAALALDNERLKADLRARVEDLRVSRARIVQAGDAARRRLERDLHDGAQQQLVSLALDLRLLRARLRDAETAAAVDDLSEKLSVALAELRELARGIHPAVLTDRGLGPAVQGLADRTPVPVTVEVELEDRPSPPIEAAAYFVVAEALTNVAKYAQAGEASVEIRRIGDDVVVSVDDDGVGGATLEEGSGLRGMQDRLSALDGTLTLRSPVGGGTHLRARIPCGASTLMAESRGKERTPSPRALGPRR
jgi:signal transduction histidine kinase